jgi:hypothetical protein
MATSSTAAEFRLSLDEAFQTEVEEVVVLVTKKIALEALNKVVMRSPVDTGRFRANWNVSFGSPDLAITENKDKPGQETIAKGGSLIGSLDRLNQIWISNNLPYANRLENGWSKQAPAGMVALTFAELSTIARIE